MTLTARQVDQAKPGERPYKLADAHGLYLYVAPTGLKSWRKNYKRGQRQATKTFGRWPEMTLAEARQACMEFSSASAGQARQAPTFEAVFREWLRVKLPALSNPKHQGQVRATVERFVLPALGGLAVDQISRAQFVGVVRDVDAQGINETAHRVAGRIGQIMDFAVDSGHIELHAASGLTRVLSARRKPRHMASLPPAEVPQLLADIESYGDVITRLALRLLALTFVRTCELRSMRWAELVDGDDVWLIPGERMKRRVPHVVPLSAQALAVLGELRAINGHREYVLDSPQRPGHPISENTMLFALYKMGYRGRMTGHGFRALASTVLNEQSPFPADAIERQLAHRERDAVRQAYNRAEYLPQRREMMQWWADWLDRQR